MAHPYNPGRPASPELGVKFLYLEFTTTTSGTVGTVVRTRGFNTPVRASAGRYTLALSSAWQSLIAVSVESMSATFTAGKGLKGRLVSRTLSGSTPNVVVEFVSDAGAAADVDDGATIIVKLDLKDTSV